MPTNTLNINSNNFKLQVQQGLVDGVEILEAYGERDNVGTTTSGEDIWRGNQLTPTPNVIIPLIQDAGELISFVSESANDSVGGIGLRSFTVGYIDVNGDSQVWSANSNGTTPVDSGILMRFIQYVHSTSTGSNGVASGNCKVYKTGSTSVVYNMIHIGGNMSLTSSRMVPRGKTLFLQRWDCSEANSRRLTMRIRSTDFNGVFISGVFLFKDSCYIKNSVSRADISSIHPEFSIIKVTGWAETSGAEVSAGWWGYLVDNN